MSHVDEGALHAYLDGALDEYPASEAQRVRGHLEVCAVCRERLETERGIRDAAGAILAQAAPEVVVPSLEELRAYVRANAPRRSPVSVRLYRLSWAASLVLALGTGWMLRGEQIPVRSPDTVRLDQERPGEASREAFGPPESGVSEVEQAVEELPSDSRVLEDRVAPAAQPGPTLAPGRVQDVAALRQSAGVDASTPAIAEATPAAEDRPASPEITADLDVSGAAPTPAPRLDEVVATSADRLRAEVAASAAPAPADDRAAGAAGAAREPGSVATGPAATAEPGRRSAQGQVVTSANQAGPATGLATQRRSIELGEQRDEVAEVDASGSLVVPGLEVLEVRFRGSGVRQEGQVVLQRLESGDTLRVIHLPPEIDPSSLEEPASGVAQVTAQSAAGWIVMRAALSEASLKELLDLLLSEP